MKKETITYASNGFEIRANNKRVRVVKHAEKEYFQLKFDHFIGTEHLTALATNERGIASLTFNLSKEMLFVICEAVFVLEQNRIKENKP